MKVKSNLNCISCSHVFQISLKKFPNQKRLENLLFHGGQSLAGSGLLLLLNAGLALLVGALDGASVLVAVGGLDQVTVTSVGDAGSSLLLELRVLTDLLVALTVHILDVIGTDVVLDELGESDFVALRILLLQHLHVLLDVSSDDALQVGGSIIGVVTTTLLGLGETRELLDGVRNVETTVDGTLQDTAPASSRDGALKTDVKEDLERAALGILVTRCWVNS